MIRSAQPLSEYFVFESEISSAKLRGFQKLLDRGAPERDLQRFLESNPEILAQHLGGGHGRWVIPQKRLGSEHVTDFLIGEKASGGYLWIAVELESSRAQIFTKGGEIGAAARHAIRQITDWRIWLQKNLDYAQRERENKGLGLEEIHPQLHGYIIIGRRSHIQKEWNLRRRQLEHDMNVTIMSYDRLVEWAQTRANHWESHFKSMRKLHKPVRK